MKRGEQKPLYQVLASKLAWTPTEPFKLQKSEEISALMELMPSGGGWDNGTALSLDLSHRNLLVFSGGWHHMNSNGYYDGWTAHMIRVKPDLVSGIDITISGRNRNDIKDYLHEMFDFALRQLVDKWPLEEKRYQELKLEEI
jgi:hypothetical protein